jgi:transcriptional regulator with XRE-family HTH domain
VKGNDIMSFNFSDNLKKIRKDKNVSQEKLASYLNISYQAVSKWENGNSYPDITLLPNIARYLDISVDELLGVNEIDKEKKYEEYYEQAGKLFQNGMLKEHLELWLNAYKELPNSFEVKEGLMCAYFDYDVKKYFNEIVELATDIYNNDTSMYNKGQAIKIIANTYAENDNKNMANKWAKKSVPLFCSRELIEYQLDDGEDLLKDIKFNIYWFTQYFYWMSSRIVHDETVSRDIKYKQDAFKIALKVYDAVYIDMDMPYWDLRNYYVMCSKIAHLGVMINDSEDDIKLYIGKAKDSVLKSINIKKHSLKTPMIEYLEIEDTPTNKLQIVNLMKNFLILKEFDRYRDHEWFINIAKEVTSCS